MMKQAIFSKENPKGKIQEIENVYEEVSVASQIEELKNKLTASDYKAIKFAEGWISEEDYAPIKAERQALRDKINELESKR